MGLFSDVCPECGATIRKGANFCPQCQAPAPSAWVVCPACKQEVRAGKYCTACGAALWPEEQVDEAERRGVLLGRLREVLTKQKMEEFTSGKDFEQFVRQTEHELAMQDVIRQAEMAELVATFEQKQQDAEIARKHLLEKLQLEHRMAVMRQEHALDDQQLEHRRQEERKDLEHRQQTEWNEFLQRKRIVEGDLETKGKKWDFAKRVRHERIELDAEKMRLEQEAKDREQQRELAELRELSRAEQERLAADLKKTELLKDLSVDQILAFMAKDSPELTAALVERARAAAAAGTSAEVKALYEKLVAGKEAEAARLERVFGTSVDAVTRTAAGAAARQREHQDEVKQVVGEDMQRMADVAVAKAGATGFGGAGAAEVVCPNCHRQVPAGSKFCDNCGHRFFE